MWSGVRKYKDTGQRFLLCGKADKLTEVEWANNTLADTH